MKKLRVPDPTEILSRSQKQWVKGRIGKTKKWWVDRFASYDGSAIRERLRKMGLRRGDTLLMHAAFRLSNGFTGKPQDLIDAVLDVIGPSGTLVMMSMSYQSSTADHLADDPVFDAARTPSKMGIVTEIFRRYPGTRRSLSPTHSIVCCGKHAERLVEGHENCSHPCGPDSPFDRMLQLDAKMLFFDLPFLGFTFIHYIEHMLANKLPFALYDNEPRCARYRDDSGLIRQTQVFVFSKQASSLRDVTVLTEYMRKERLVSWERIGNTELVLARMRDAVSAARELAERDIYPFRKATVG